MKNETKLALIGGAIFLVGNYLGKVQGYTKGVCVTAQAYIDKEEREKLKIGDPE